MTLIWLRGGTTLQAAITSLETTANSARQATTSLSAAAVAANQAVTAANDAAAAANTAATNANTARAALTAATAMGTKDRADLVIKLAVEFATRSRHHDTIRASISVGLIAFTSAAFVLFAFVYNSQVVPPLSPGAPVTLRDDTALKAIALFVLVFGAFGVFFSWLRNIEARSWSGLAKGYTLAAEALLQIDPANWPADAGPAPRSIEDRSRPGWFVVAPTWLLMLVSMIGPGLLLLGVTMKSGWLYRSMSWLGANVAALFGA
jgi:hypothetical protein